MRRFRRAPGGDEIGGCHPRSVLMNLMNELEVIL
jgi:hypothetical protein